MRGLEWQTLQVPLAAGLAQKEDERALEPPGLSICKDAQFDEVGGLQTRYPYAALSSLIHTTGTLANIRRIAVNGSELLAFTKDSLYSWNATLSRWVLKATHLAVKVEEKTVFSQNVEQTEPARAELNGTAVYSWVDLDEVLGVGVVWAAAIDVATGQVLMSPRAVTFGHKPKLITLSTRIIMFFTTIDGYVAEPPSLRAYSIDPASPAITFDSPATVVFSHVTNGAGFYDAERIPSSNNAIFAYNNPDTGNYVVGVVTGTSLTVTTAAKARVSGGPIALTCTPGGATFHVFRKNAANIQGDRIAFGGLADFTINQAIGTLSGAFTTFNHITAAYKSVTDGGAHRCHVFWTESESSSAASWECKTNYVDTAGAIGTESRFQYQLGISSRAFDYDGNVYFIGVFAGESSFSGASSSNVRSQLQNTYFLYRHDSHLVAKFAAGKAGGFNGTGTVGGVAMSQGHLAHVQNTGGTTFAWPGTERQIVDLGDTTATDQARVTRGYAARSPRLIQFTFDSDEARRTAKIGATLYVSGGEIMQYDGSALTEVGFHVFPWNFGGIALGGGTIEVGSYTYKMTWEWTNHVGEVDRSTTATSGIVAVGAPGIVQIGSAKPVRQTRKVDPSALVWRTAKDPTADAPFYLATSRDPSARTNPNRFLYSIAGDVSIASFNDEMIDATLTDKSSDPENGLLLEYLAPPAATIIVASASRLFLAGVAGDPNRVWYSRQRRDGEVASFHDALVFDVPLAGGKITALEFINETLVVFKETAIYALPGDGFDNTGAGQNYGPARLIATDVGAASQESIAVTPSGIVFKSQKGWYLLSRGLGVDYIGGAVSNYDAESVKGVIVVEKQHQVRCLTGSRMLVWDYLVNQWAEWTVSGGVSSDLWNGAHMVATSSAVSQQQTTYTGLTYGMDIETAWIKMNGLQGYGRVRWMQILGEYRSAHKLRIRIARDYQSDGAGGALYFDDKYWTPSLTVVGGGEQVRHGPKEPRGEAFKIRITAVDSANTANPPSGEALKLTGLALEAGIYRGAYRRLPAGQKQ